MRDHYHLPIAAHPFEGVEDVLLDCHLRYLVFGLIDDVDSVVRAVLRQKLEEQATIESGRRFAVDADFFVGYLPSLVQLVDKAVKLLLDVLKAGGDCGLCPAHGLGNLLRRQRSVPFDALHYPVAYGLVEHFL